MKTNLLKLTCGLALLGAVAPASAQSLIDIQFNSPGYQQTGAAVIGQSGDYWNLLTAYSGTSSLMDSQAVFHSPGLPTVSKAEVLRMVLVAVVTPI